MASTSVPSSSSFNTPQFVYEVFLSFRGEDTRYNFTSHLYKALDDKGIQTFIDYELKRGDEISPALLKAIEESQISVIIFSKDYASSRWCLEELVKILECKNRESNKQIVIPVFYGVTPSDVRNQTGNFADAFAKHEEDFRDNLDKVQRWKDALNEAANLSGWHLDANDKKPESVLIEAIIEDVLTRLSDLSSSDISHLVGMDSKIKEIKSWLFMGTNDVRSLGIWGIGGIGKTTLAEAVFNNISRRFDGSCFIHNVREHCEQSGGLNRLQQEFLSRILGDKNVNKGAYVVGRTFLKNRFGRKKLLIVLDDVYDFRQLEYLIGDFDCLSQESRIIITTRDKQVLRSCGVDQIYEVQELIRQEALQLFCGYAFKGNHATMDFMELSNRVTRCAGGVPLALKILGSYLLDKGKEVWESAMNKLIRIPHTDIHKVLRISYDGLDNEEQKIFLDIACFFKGSDIELVKSFIDACGFNTEVGISVLIDKSLVFMSYNKITMHDLIQATAWEIVRQESKEDPGKRSRLWNHEDIFHVLTKNTGTEAIEGISLNMSNVRDMFLNPYAFANMHKLRFLEFSISCYKLNRNKVHIFQGLESNFSELRYLKWDACPLESLPSSYHLDNLITLHMRNSKVKQLWNGVQHLVKLKEIDLASSSFTNCRDLSGFPNLERLILKKCRYLREISSSLKYLTKLDLLDLSSCTSLKGVPDCSGLTSLRKLDLSYCVNLEILPEMPYNIKELNLRFTATEELPLSIMYLSRLVVLNLSYCMRLKSLPSSISKWKSLKTLYVSFCSKLDQLPNDIGTSDSLEVLEAEKTAIKELPSSIADLKNLKQLNFNRCTQATVCWSLPRIVGWLNLTQLNLSYSGIIELPDNLGCLSSLEVLHLGGNGFESITANITNISKLRVLDISNCYRLKYLPELQFREIRAPGCTSLEVLSPLSFQKSTGPPYYIRVDFGYCFKLDRNVFEDTLKDALLKQCQKEHSDKGDEDRVEKVRLWYPGNEIPKWFEFQRTGSSITVKLQPDWFNHYFVGFALCIVLAPILDYHIPFKTSISIRWNCTFKSIDGNHHVKDGLLSILEATQRPVSRYFGFTTRPISRNFGSHVFVKSYMPISPHKLLCYDNEISFDFITNKTCLHKVKKCGVHLMFAKHIEDDFSSNIHGNYKEVDEPHNKGLKLAN